MDLWLTGIHKNVRQEKAQSLMDEAEDPEHPPSRVYLTWDRKILSAFRFGLKRRTHPYSLTERVRISATMLPVQSDASGRG
jgi:hypothetical protein